MASFMGHRNGHRHGTVDDWIFCGGETISKSENIVWMAGLPDDDPRHAKIDAIRRGGECATEDSSLTYSITEIAKRARTSRPLIYRAIQTGALVAAPLYPGGRQRIRESDFRRWISARGWEDLGYKKGKL